MMKRGRSFPAKEILYLWTGNGIVRIRRPVQKTSPPAANGHALFPPEPLLEKRRYPRLDLELPILYKVLGEDIAKIPTKVRPFLMAQSTNVSPLGLCLNLVEQFNPGTVLALSIHVLEKREKFSAVGHVIWAKPSETPGYYLTGIRFVVVDGENVVREEDQNRAAEMLHLFDFEE